MLCTIFSDIESRQTRRDSNKGLKAGMKGLKKRRNPHLLDVQEMVSSSGEKISETVIARCGIRSNVLQVGTTTDLTAQHGEMRTDQKNPVIVQMIKDFKKLSISITLDDP